MDFSVFEHAENYSGMQGSKIEDFTRVFSSTQQMDDYPAYEYAALFASFAETYFQIMGGFPQTFFQQDQWGEPEVDGDTWIWEWSFAAEGESLTMTITAEDVGNERHWELRYTTEGSEEDLTNALLIASQVRLDGSGGAWQIHDFFETEEPVFQVEYELDGDITTMVDMRFDDDEDGRFQYERDGDISSLQVHDVYSSGLTFLEWNNETGTGKIESPNYRDGEIVCWDENFQDTGC